MTFHEYLFLLHKYINLKYMNKSVKITTGVNVFKL